MENALLYVVLAFFLGVVTVYALIEIKEKCFLRNSSKSVKMDIVKKLARQSGRWSTAAGQDENPMVATLHANYGAAYLWAIQSIATSEEFEEATGLDMMEFIAKVSMVQDEKTKTAIRNCPVFGPEKSVLTAIAGEG